MKDFNTWFHEVGKKRMFTMWELRRPGDWTPYEMEKKFTDESFYKDIHGVNVFLREAIELPDGDILLGIKYIYDYDDLEDKPEKEVLHYKKLSQIELEYDPNDNID